MKCPNCNKNIDDNASYCQYCGAKIEKEKLTLLETDLIKTKKILSIFLGISVLIIAFLFMAYSGVNTKYEEAMVNINELQEQNKNQQTLIKTYKSEIEELKNNNYNNASMLAFIEKADLTPKMNSPMFYCKGGNVVVLKPGEVKKVSIYMGVNGTISIKTTDTLNGNCVDRVLGDFDDNGNIDITMQGIKPGMELINVSSTKLTTTFNILAIVTE